MKTAIIFVQKNLIDLNKESFTLSKIINQTGKEFVRILNITGCFVFFCCRVKVFLFFLQLVLDFVRTNYKTYK